MSLEFALNLAFYSSVQNKGCILIFCDSANIAIVKEKNEFAVFDSHSRSVSGLCEPDGTCIISFYENIKTLCTFIRSLCHSMSNRQLDEVQYDLHCVDLRHSRSRSDTFNISKPKKSVTCCKQNCSESTDLDKVDKEYMYKAIKTKKTLKQRTFAVKASQDTIFSIGSKNSSGDKEILQGSRKRQNPDIPTNKKQKKTCITTQDTVNIAHIEHTTVNLAYMNSEPSTSHVESKVGSCAKQHLNTKLPQGLDLDKLETCFRLSVLDGPSYACTSCNQLWFKESVSLFRSLSCDAALLKKCSTGCRSVKN